MLDPLTSLSIAANVAQFIDFGTKLLVGGFEIYRSTHGATAENQQLSMVVEDLGNVTNSLGSVDKSV